MKVSNHLINLDRQFQLIYLNKVDLLKMDKNKICMIFGIKII